MPTMGRREATLQALGLSALLVGAGVVLGIAADRNLRSGGDTTTSSPVVAESKVPTTADAPPPPPRRSHRRMLKRFTHRLFLTKAQAKQVDTILEGIRGRLHKAHVKLRPQLDAAMEEGDELIAAVLNKKQRTEYARMVKERKRRHQRRGRGFRGPPPPPGFRGGPPRRGRRGRRGPRPIEMLDKNGDEKLSKPEVQDAPGWRGRRLLDNFDEIDTNKDGFLTRSELRAHRRHRRPPRP